MKKYLILVIDGCAPEYLTRETAPQLWELAQREGFIGTALGAVPTVTNVNHACILSGRFPEETGVVGNYYYRPDTGKHGFVEERGFMKAPTLFQAVHARGGKSALLTVKGKVLGVYGDDVDIGLSAQSPDPGLLRRLGLDAPPSISDIACTRWILEAALACVRREDPELIYCTTNDYGFHHYAPGTPEALRQIGWVDEWIAAIHQADPDRRIYITADHGMNQKHRLVDIQRIADHRGIPLFALAPLKDRYIENHIYQEGGSPLSLFEGPGGRRPPASADGGNPGGGQSAAGRRGRPALPPARRLHRRLCAVCRRGLRLWGTARGQRTPGHRCGAHPWFPV